MARSSDIDFAKLALILGFTNKENVYAAIRETALLQEMKINKRLAHIMYEHNYLSPLQIQAILWALYKSRKIARFPARVVYEFTEEDDRKFLAKVALPMDQIFANFKLSGEFNRSEKVPFPQDVLIYSLDLQKQLVQKGFSRPLVSILNAKGHLQGEYRRLVPDIEAKKKLICNPLQAKSNIYIRMWESTLFSAWAVQKNKISQEQVEAASRIWGELLEQCHLPIKFSEVLAYMGVMSKGDLTKLGIFIAEFANLDQIPRFHMYDLTDDEREFVHSYFKYNNVYQKVYRNCAQIAERASHIGLNMPIEEIFIIKGDITRATITRTMTQEKQKRLKGQPSKLRDRAFDLVSTAEYKIHNLSRRFAVRRETNISKRQKKELANKMIPFSVESLEKEFETQYLEQRKAQRNRQPVEEIHSMINELSHTQLLPFEEIASSPSTFNKETRSQITPFKARENTEYISLDMSDDNAPSHSPKGNTGQAQKIEETSYISLDASPDEMQQFSNTIVQKQEMQRHPFKMFMALFVVAAGVALVEPKFEEIFGKIPLLPIYTGVSMFMTFLPALFLGHWMGKISDRGYVHQLYGYGFLIYALSLIPMPFVKDIYLHCGIRFIQGIGLCAIFVAAEYCIGRWYGPLERGKTMGVAMMVFSIGFCIGFVMPKLFEPLQKVFGISTLIISSLVWAVAVIIMIPITIVIKLTPLLSEDIEEELGEDVVIDKKPLIAAALYGITEMGLFAVFFPCHAGGVPLGGELISSEILIMLLGVGAFLSSYFLGWLSDRIGAIPILTFLSLVAIIAFALIAIVDEAMVKFLFFIVGVVVGGLSPLGFSWLLEVTDNDRYIGIASGAFSQYQGAGSMFGCIFCGIAFYALGITGFLTMLSLIYIAYFYLLITTSQHEKLGGKRGRLGGILRLLGPIE